MTEQDNGRAGTAAVLAVAAALVYVGFFGWDRDVTTDPSTGSTSGPYATWQVAGSTVVLGLLAVPRWASHRPWLSAAAISLGFTAAWSVGAATMPTEDASLWPVGAALLAPGVFIPTALVGLVARLVARRRLAPAGHR